MSVYTSILAKFAFADAIAVNQISITDTEHPNFKHFVALQLATRNALAQWPGGKLDLRTIEKIQSRLVHFVDAVSWEHTPVHVQSMLNFSLMQMVDLLENKMITNPVRLGLIAQIGDALHRLYLAASADPDHERPECIDEGLRAVQLWNEIVEE